MFILAALGLVVIFLLLIIVVYDRNGSMAPVIVDREPMFFSNGERDAYRALRAARRA